MSRAFIVFRPEVIYRAYLLDAENEDDALEKAELQTPGIPVIALTPDEVLLYHGKHLPRTIYPWVVRERPSPEEFLETMRKYEG